MCSQISSSIEPVGCHSREFSELSIVDRRSNNNHNNSNSKANRMLISVKWRFKFRNLKQTLKQYTRRTRHVLKILKWIVPWVYSGPRNCNRRPKEIYVKKTKRWKCVTNWLLAKPLPLFSSIVIIINVIRQREREGEKESRVKLSSALISAVSWLGQATKYFECTWDISLEPQRLPHCCQNISMRFVWCPVVVHVFYHSGSGSLGPTCCAVFWWDLNMTADLLTVSLNVCLPLPLPFSPSLFVCACVCFSWTVC